MSNFTINPITMLPDMIGDTVDLSNIYARLSALEARQDIVVPIISGNPNPNEFVPLAGFEETVNGKNVIVPYSINFNPEVPFVTNVATYTNDLSETTPTITFEFSLLMTNTQVDNLIPFRNIAGNFENVQAAWNGNNTALTITMPTVGNNVLVAGDTFEFDLSSLRSMDIHNLPLVIGDQVQTMTVPTLSYYTRVGSNTKYYFDLPNTPLSAFANTGYSTSQVIINGLYVVKQEIENIVFGSGYKNITGFVPNQFYNYMGLKNVDFSVFAKNITNIPSWAFYYCSALTSLDFSSCPLENIEEYAFFNCRALTTINFNNCPLTRIGLQAFWYCTSLTSINFNGCPIANIDNRAFNTCISLKSLDFNNASLNAINSGVFISCSSLASINFGNSQIASIGGDAFSSCRAFTSLDFSSHPVVSIGAGAFYDCRALTSINFNNCPLTSIGDYAFFDCNSLTSLDFSSNPLVSIGTQTFQGSTSLIAFKIGNNDFSTIQSTSSFSGLNQNTRTVYAATQQLGEIFKQVTGMSNWNIVVA
ncbi:MAG: leucine-rich repeat domain-containing protein [Bacteroidetes bacterium]|nr:leucine-rich repeat domain-containing protein [Bacteroidota bacterium]